jgi:amino acid permease
MKIEAKNDYNSVRCDEGFSDDHIQLIRGDFSDLDSPGLKQNIQETGFSEWSSSCINLTSTVIGAGIIGMPFAFSKCGWILGTVLIFVSAFLSAFGSHLLACCALKRGLVSSFYSVSQATIPSFSAFVDGYISLVCFGVATSYLCIIGDSLPLVMEQLNTLKLFQNRSVCIALAFVLIAPISFMPSLDALKFTSWLSGAMLLYLVLLIFLYALDIPDTPWLDPCVDSVDGQCKGPEYLFLWTLDTVRVMPIFIFNFSCQQNVFTIVNELKEPTPRRINSVILASVGVSGVLYLVVAFSAYATFGGRIVSDILQMYPGKITSCVT